MQNPWLLQLRISGGPDDAISGCSEHSYISFAQGGDLGVTWAGQEGKEQPSEEIGRRLVMNGPLERLVRGQLLWKLLSGKLAPESAIVLGGYGGRGG